MDEALRLLHLSYKGKTSTIRCRALVMLNELVRDRMPWAVPDLLEEAYRLNEELLGLPYAPYDEG